MIGRAAALALAALVTPALAGDPVTVQSIEVALPETAVMQFRGAIAIRPPGAAFGGISGLARMGDEMLAITDRGSWLRFRLVREGGILAGIRDLSMEPIQAADGAPVSGAGRDAEDIAVDPQTGHLWVSFEGDHRIAAYESTNKPAYETLRQQDWQSFSRNGGLEALAFDDAGRLWALAERSGSLQLPIPVYVRQGSVWQSKALPRIDGHAVTGAAFGPKGWLYLTERDFSLLGGFVTRLRRVFWGAGDTPEASETLIEFGGKMDNLEAVTLWQEGARTFVLLASDDNFMPFQRNLLALYELRPN